MMDNGRDVDDIFDISLKKIAKQRENIFKTIIIELN